MSKVFTTNKDGKIELTKDELKNLLDEAYWDGFRANCTTFTYQTPNWTPYSWTTSGATATISANDISHGTITVQNSKEDEHV